MTAITVNLKLKTGSTNGAVNVDITTYWEKSRTHRVDYVDNVATASLTLTTNILDTFEI